MTEHTTQHQKRASSNKYQEASSDSSHSLINKEKTQKKDAPPLSQHPLHRLLTQLCPEGVEYKELQEIFTTKNGYTPSKANKAFWTNGTIPWFRMEDIRENGRVLGNSLQHITKEAVKGGKLFPAHSIIIATSATIGEHALITVPHLSNQRFTSLIIKPKYANILDIKFIFYYGFILSEWCHNNTSTSSFPSVDMAGFKKFPIPLPPLEIQKKIVDILDQFFTLEAQLEAELKARTKQYHYYRNALLTFDKETLNSHPLYALITKLCPNGVEVKALGEVATFKRGRVISKDYLKDNTGPYPVYSSQTANNGIFGRINTYDYEHESITWTTDGAHAGSIFYHKDEKFTITNVCGLITLKDNQKISLRFLYHYLGLVAKNYVYYGMGNPKLMSNQMQPIKIPLPPLEIQEKIVSILDRFDALVNDISIGLPAEITARQKQYHYYRDNLLNFEHYS